MSDGSKKAEHIPPHVGTLVRKWRNAAGKTQEQVADALGVGKSHISQVETGTGNLSLPKFLALCRFLGVPASRLLEDAFPPKERDLDRLTKDLAGHVGVRDLAYLAALSKPELTLFLDRGREAVEYARSRVRDRIRHKQADRG
jgi:transcriptional regulator with XRE-family HTH domain